MQIASARGVMPAVSVVECWCPPAGVGLPGAPAAPTLPVVGRVQDPRLTEVSGIVASRTHPGVLWVHNDSGDRARIFAIRETGEVVAEVRVARARAFDWEDIAIGPGPDAGRSYLYVADTGDNLRIRRTVQVYRFPEPDAVDGAVSADRISFRYPDGRAHDVESMFVDPRSGDLYVVAKTEAAAVVYRAAREVVAGGGGMLEQVATIPTDRLTTGATITADGSAIAVRTYKHVYVWRRGDGQAIADAFAAPPVVIASPPAEAITFTSDGSALITVNEGVGQPIYRFPTPQE